MEGRKFLQKNGHKKHAKRDIAINCTKEFPNGKKRSNKLISVISLTNNAVRAAREQAVKDSVNRCKKRDEDYYEAYRDAFAQSRLSKRKIRSRTTQRRVVGRTETIIK